MKILLTFDTGYAPHAAVVMESAIQHCPVKLDFVVLYADLTQEYIDILTEHFESKVNSLCFYRVPKEKFIPFKSVKTLAHIKNPESALLRLFCGEYSFDDEWVLYLDCDMIVMEDVRKILDHADPNKIICAVSEYDAFYKVRDLSQYQDIERPAFEPWIYEAYWYRTLKQLKMNLDGKYFCSGQMLINLSLWRKNDLGNKVLEYILANPETCFATDQDALNHLINGDYGVLPPRWNNVVVYDGIFANYSINELYEMHNNPAIIHIAGAMKPWHYMAESKYKRLYSYYRQFTPWPKVIYPDKNLKNIVKKQIGLIMSLLKKVLGKRFCLAFKTYRHYNKREGFWAQARLKSK